MGTAPTHARRYALFTLVGIAGEDIAMRRNFSHQAKKFQALRPPGAPVPGGSMADSTRGVRRGTIDERTAQRAGEAGANSAGAALGLNLRSAMRRPGS
jgi:hypothetical protein